MMNMKKIVYYILGAAAMLAAASCSKNVNWEEVKPVDGQQGLTLKFFSGKMDTKATVDGENNENRVFQIDYYIFPVDSADIDGKPAVKKATEYVYSGHIDVENLTTITETITDADGVFNQIFPNGAKTAKVFAVANYVGKYGANNDMASPDTKIPEDAKSWGDLHALEVGATFFYDDQDPDFGLRWPHVLLTDSDDLFFVMTGEADLEFDPKEGSTAEVPLKRLASKVTANFTYENFREEKTDKDGDVTAVIMWIPQETAGETRVYLSNAIEHTTLGGPLTRAYVADSWGTATKPLGNGTRDLFEYAYNFMNDVPVIDGKKTAHFYTYPINIKEGDDNQPYLKLVLPWYGYKWVGNGTAPQTAPDDIETNENWMMYKQKEVYYKIVLPRETIKDPNCIYEYSIKVNIIGSDKEVKIIGEEYVVKDWLSDEAISSNVATGLYLSLDIPKDEYDMYVDEIDINFVSSGTVEAQVLDIYQWNYSGNTPTQDHFMQNNAVVASNDLRTRKGIAQGTPGDDVIKGWVTIPQDASYLKINHELCNDITVTPISKFDAAPYVYVVRLHLVEAGTNTNFDRTVTITQYPAMYIIAETNSAYGTSNNYGYVYVNGQQNTRDENWYLVTGLSGNNSNPNMFVITSTVLTDPNMILADPRTSTVQNGYNSNNNSWSPSRASMYETENRRLMYYYPTDASATASQKVSPKFRIASSYGKTIPVSRQEAFQRCASYQEDGYPAGRWRIPTTAEVKYVVNLSANGFIDILFGSATGTTPYWTASGYVEVNNASNKVTPHDGDTTGDVWVRCVYDEWYWSDKATDKSSFIWGDKQR